MNGKINLYEIFGSNVFNDSVMRERLPKVTYKELKNAIKNGTSLQPTIAEVIANAMKDWAIEKGATHFTHWFQPMTGITAEKHDSFISPTDDGKVMMEFSYKELIKGESDASSFPSGGLRATFEARGYTAWDYTSPAFIKEDNGGNKILCIPTAFCSYTGEALDEKTPLLRSMEAVSKQAVRVLKLFGNNTTRRVIAMAGAEQEYFLVDKQFYNKRKDLIYTGRTLFGAKPPKGQELEDHYYSCIKERISAFMNEFNIEVWKLGVSAKTQHNEVAPAQHEIAPIYNNANITTDHNQLLMETLKKVATRHGFVCLLHEKPFKGINGSGKHNNWSLATDDGQNLFEPGKTPHENLQFLTFLCAVIKAVDEHAELLRLSAGNAGNDHRLGAAEAPPAIISIYLGEQLTDTLKQFENGSVKNSYKGEKLQIGVSTFSPFLKDSTDRNRTSPFAFTGNKFEFRMVPSSASIAGPNTVLNTIVADSLSEIADRLEQTSDFKSELQKIIKEIFKKHKRIIFNGDNYSEEWIKEAHKRGLSNIQSTVDAVPYLITDKSINLFGRQKVFSKKELYSRYEVILENYSKQVRIEALTMIEMARRQILPASINFVGKVANSLNLVKTASIGADISAQEELVKEVSSLIASFNNNIKLLNKYINKDISISNAFDYAKYYREKVLTQMEKLRENADRLENIVEKSLWPFPTYGKLLFYI